MVASPADPVIARVFGGVVIASDSASGPASYDDHGRRFVFVPAPGDTARYALDVEHRDSEVPPFLARHFAGLSRPFFEHWTELEVIAKLGGQPVLELVKEGVESKIPTLKPLILRVDTPTHWIAVGKLSNSGPTP